MELSAEQSGKLIEYATDAVVAYRGIRVSRPETTTEFVAALSNLSFIFRFAADSKASIVPLEEALEVLSERTSNNQQEYLPALVDCLRDLLDLTNYSGQKEKAARLAIELRKAQELLRHAERV
jgi:hypothetical protein